MSNGNTVVVGLQWGDEGKGQLVDLLAEEHDVVVRYNGGNNAGHTVQADGERHALHLLPSGILDPGKLNVIGNGVVVDPEGLLGEIDGLVAKGREVGDNLRISDRAHVVLPWHRLEDGLREATARGPDGRGEIGTTRRGIGPAYADKMLRTSAVRMADLIAPHRLGDIVAGALRVKNAVLSALAGLAGEPWEDLEAGPLLERLEAWGSRLRPHVTDTGRLLHDEMARGRRLLFEGANASLLDVDHGTYPFVTSSSSSALGVHAGAGVPASAIDRVVGVAKLYTSRVGAGPFPTELLDGRCERLREKGDEFGTTTGRPRRCGWLDLAALRYTVRLSGVTEVACTGMAVLAGQDPLRVAIGYRRDGEDVEGFPASPEGLAEVEPVYEELPGFQEEVDGCRRFEELPEAARRYVGFVEESLGIPVGAVCVGRDRSQVLRTDG